MRYATCLLLACLLVASTVHTQQAPPAVAERSDQAAARDMATLAQRLIATYQQSDRFTYLDNLFRLQLAAGQYADVAATIDALLQAAAPDARAALADRMSPYQMFAAAKAATGTRFEDAFGQAFRQRARALDDHAALQ